MDEEPDMNNEEDRKRVDSMYARLDEQERIAKIGEGIRANAIQEGGTHYKDKSIQPWDYIIANNLGYLEGNIVKYVSRWKDKGGIEDLKKAQHYLQKLIEVTEKAK